LCPQCGYEYREGMGSCPDCGCALKGAASYARPRLSKEPLVVIYEAPDELLSRAVKNVLEEAGMPVVEQVERTSWYDNVDLSMVGRYSRLLTLESRAEEARQIVADFLRAYQRGDLALPEEGQE